MRTNPTFKNLKLKEIKLDDVKKTLVGTPSRTFVTVTLTGLTVASVAYLIGCAASKHGCEGIPNVLTHMLGQILPSCAKRHANAAYAGIATSSSIVIGSMVAATQKFFCKAPVHSENDPNAVKVDVKAPAEAEPLLSVKS